MRSLPQGLGLIHFVGIGGIGMSGIAEVLHNLGYKVQGSDLSEGGNTARLTALGIPVMVGHKAENIGAAEVVVVSSAIKPDNPEILAARARRVPVVRRAEMLGELMRLKWAIAVAGTHGKTTTTSMIGALLETAQMDPTVINGGIINAYGTNTRLGAGDWMVVEADESDGTFTKLPAAIAVVTNIDPEHLDHYGDFAALQAGVRELCRQHSVLRLCRVVHRPSGRAGDDRQAVRAPRRSPTASARRPISARSTFAPVRAAANSTPSSPSAPPAKPAPSTICSCRCSATTTC